jgi:hypothetical protein
LDAPYHDGDDVEDQGDDPHNLSGPVRTLRAEVVARLDGGKLYGDALDQEEANQKTGNAKHYIPTVVRKPYSRPSGVRRSIHSSASARVMSLSGLPRRFSSYPPRRPCGRCGVPRHLLLVHHVAVPRFISDDRHLTGEGIAARDVLLGEIEAIEQDLEAIRQEHGLDWTPAVHLSKVRLELGLISKKHS